MGELSSLFHGRLSMMVSLGLVPTPRRGHPRAALAPQAGCRRIVLILPSAQSTRRSTTLSYKAHIGRRLWN